MTKASKVIEALHGKSIATAESCTGGLVGGALTAVSGASVSYKGGIVSYQNEIKHRLLGVEEEVLSRFGAVSAPVAMAMAQGARKMLEADYAVSVTGLAGPGGDEYGNPVGTVFIGFADEHGAVAEKYHFCGNRDAVRKLAVDAALELVLKRI